MDDQLEQGALDFHKLPVPRKIQVSLTKSLATQRDLALAYSSDVAVPCLEIEKDPLKVYKYTARGNLVAVISNGTAVLGLGNIGALADKSATEGKDVLFKRFAGIDIFDIGVGKLDPDKFIEVVATLEPTFDGINLEDTRAPGCFYTEQKLHGWVNIPVLHDGQHGTTIISTAAILSGLRVVKKSISDVWMVVSGVGAIAITCTNLLVALGLQKHNVMACDSKGVICQDREPNMAETKAAYTAVDDGKRTLDDVIEGVDIFLGCSGPKVLIQEMVKKMAHTPTTLALANPEPEVLPSSTKEVCPNAITCIGRSDYLNQVNNVLCFPSIFRSALDADTTATSEEMKLAAVCAIAELTHAEQSKAVALAYGDQNLGLGPEYIIPKSFDPRLIVKIVPAAAKVAMESGVATHPIADFDVYIDKLTEFVYKTSLFMKPTSSQTHKVLRRVVLPEGEEVRVLHATRELVTLGLAKPILIGRPNVIEMHIQRLGLQIKPGIDLEIVNNEPDPCFKECWTEHFQVMKRRGVAQEQAQRALISDSTVIDAIMTRHDEVDAMICGTMGDYHEHFNVVKNVFGYRDGVHTTGAMNALLLPSGNTFTTDTYASDEPDAGELAEITLMVAEVARRSGIKSCVALLPHSNFGSSDCPSSSKMHQALELVRERTPRLMIDGEMYDGATLVEAIRNDRTPDSPLKSSVNILVMPSMKAARISYNLLHIPSSEDVTVGLVLMGVAKSVHVLTPIALVRRIVSMVALVVVEAQTQPSQFFFNSHVYSEYSG